MNTLDRIAEKEALKRKNLDRIAGLRATFLSREKVRNDYYALWKNCPKIGGKDCKEDRMASIRTIEAQLNSIDAEITSLKESNIVLDNELVVLRKTAETERANSAVVTQTLAQQGLTVQAVEDTAETEAEVQAEIARQDAAQNLEQDKQLNYIWMIALVIAIIVAIVIIRKRLKKK